MPLRVFLILGIGVLLGFGLSIGRPVKAEREIAAPEERSVPWRDMRLLAEVLQHVRREYVEDISDEQLLDAAIRGMVADLDPHSAYLDPSEFNEIRISTTGEYSGVGIEVALEEGRRQGCGPD